MSVAVWLMLTSSSAFVMLNQCLLSIDWWLDRWILDLSFFWYGWSLLSPVVLGVGACCLSVSSHLHWIYCISLMSFVIFYDRVTLYGFAIHNPDSFILLCCSFMIRNTEWLLRLGGCFVVVQTNILIRIYWLHGALIYPRDLGCDLALSSTLAYLFLAKLTNMSRASITWLLYIIQIHLTIKTGLYPTNKDHCFWKPFN